MEVIVIGKLPGSNCILEYKEFPKYPNEIGMKFGYLEVLHEIECDDIPGVVYELRCKCGNETFRRRANLYQNINMVQSCGCYHTMLRVKHFTKHGNWSKDKRLYTIWHKMKERCHNPKNPYYKDYGNRGITVCRKWYNNFNHFYKWAMKNGYKKHLTIERTDNDKGYNPSNCKWIPMYEQAKNRRSTSKFLIAGKWITQKELAIEMKVSETTIKSMAKDGRLKYDSWHKSSRALF